MKLSIRILTLASCVVFAASCGQRPIRPLLKAIEAGPDQQASEQAVARKVAHLVTTKEISKLCFKVKVGGRIVANECGTDDAIGSEHFQIIRDKNEDFGQRSLYVVSEQPLEEGRHPEDTMHFELIFSAGCHGEETPRAVKLRLDFEDSGDDLKKKPVLGFGVAEIEL